jgi:hypothetical protein
MKSLAGELCKIHNMPRTTTPKRRGNGHVYEESKCVQCHRDRENRRHSEQKSHLKRKYGITLDQYNQLFAQQNGSCAICSRHQSEFKVALAVDHLRKDSI